MNQMICILQSALDSSFKDGQATQLKARCEDALRKLSKASQNEEVRGWLVACTTEGPIPSSLLEGAPLEIFPEDVYACLLPVYLKQQSAFGKMPALLDSGLAVALGWMKGRYRSLCQEYTDDQLWCIGLYMAMCADFGDQCGYPSLDTYIEAIQEMRPLSGLTQNALELNEGMTKQFLSSLIETKPEIAQRWGLTHDTVQML